MYTLKREGGKLHGPINKKVYGTFGPRKNAVQWAREQATRRGFGPETDKTVQIVLDGEICLEQRMRKAFPKAIVTLDIRHVQEKLWEVGRMYEKEGSEELEQWMEPMQEWLYEGEIEKILERLKELEKKVGKQGPGTKTKRRKLAEVRGYIEKRKAMMEYGKRREEDMVIASGVVEGAARYVIGERMDNSGMRWIEERAEAVLLLRCIEVNGDWDCFWEWAQQQRSEELRLGKPVQIRSELPSQLPQAA
jgi:hypothetical protein